MYSDVPKRKEQNDSLPSDNCIPQTRLRAAIDAERWEPRQQQYPSEMEPIHGLEQAVDWRPALCSSFGPMWQWSEKKPCNIWQHASRS